MAAVIITAAKEEVRRNWYKARKICIAMRSGMNAWFKPAQDFHTRKLNQHESYVLRYIGKLKATVT